MELINFIYLFFFYAVFGYIWEVIWVSAGQKKLTNRGFLYGPLLPIYGFGAVFITLFVDHAIERFNDSYIVIFFSGLIIATALEFITGYLIEKIFKVRYWDYTERFMNIKGLICLRSSLFFGVMSIFMMNYSNKYILELTEKIKNSNYNFVIYILIAIFSVDVVVSVKQAYGFRYIIEYQEKMESYLKEIRKDVKLKALEGSQTLEADLSGLKSALRDRIEHVEIKKSFIENSAKILEDRIERETNLKEKLKTLLDERVESAEKVDLIHDRIDKVYDKRLKRLQTHQKNIQRVAKRNDITYKK